MLPFNFDYSSITIELRNFYSNFSVEKIETCKAKKIITLENYTVKYKLEWARNQLIRAELSSKTLSLQGLKELKDLLRAQNLPVNAVKKVYALSIESLIEDLSLRNEYRASIIISLPKITSEGDLTIIEKKK